MAEDFHSPAEELIAAAEAVDGETPIRPWEPKGEAEPDPLITIVGVDLVYSTPPPRTAGGASPGVRTYLGKFGLDGV